MRKDNTRLTCKTPANRNFAQNFDEMNLKSALFSCIFLALGALDLCAQQTQIEADFVAERKREMYKTYWTSISWLPGTWSELQNDLKSSLVETWELRNDSTMVGRRYETRDGKETKQFDQYLLEKRNFRLFLTLNPQSAKPVKFKLKEKKDLYFIFENQEPGGSPGIIEISREARDAMRVAQKASPEAEHCESHTFRKG